MKICVVAAFKTFVSVTTFKKSVICDCRWKKTYDPVNEHTRTTSASRTISFNGFDSWVFKMRISKNLVRQKRTVIKTPKMKGFSMNNIIIDGINILISNEVGGTKV